MIGAGEDRTRFGIGVTALYYQEPETDTPVLFQRKHMQDMVRVGNKLPLYDMVSTIGIVRDVPDYLTDLVGSLEHFANGIKPMVLLCSDEHKFDDVLRMFETLHGRDLGEEPWTRCALPSSAGYPWSFPITVYRVPPRRSHPRERLPFYWRNCSPAWSL